MGSKSIHSLKLSNIIVPYVRDVMVEAKEQGITGGRLSLFDISISLGLDYELYIHSL